MIEIMYKKHSNKNLFKSLENCGILKAQNYIPIYENWFSLNTSNLNQRNRIVKLNKKVNNNKFICTIEKDNEETESKLLFFKFSPLLDPTKFMVGKYNNIPPDLLSSLPDLVNINISEKVRDRNNAAYVDSFFSYLKVGTFSLAYLFSVHLLIGKFKFVFVDFKTF